MCNPCYRAVLYLLPSSRSNEREKGRHDEDIEERNARIRAANDLNSPKRAKRNYSFSQDKSHRPLTFPILSRLQFRAFLPPFLSLSFTMLLPPTRFRTPSWKLMFHRLRSHCLRSSRDGRPAFSTMTTAPLSPLLLYPPDSRDFLLPRGKLESSFISVASPGTAIIMILSSKRLNVFSETWQCRWFFCTWLFGN